MARRDVRWLLLSLGLAAGGTAAAETPAGEAAAAPEPADAAAVDEALAIAARIGGAPTGLSPRAERALARTIVREARAAGLDPLLVVAVIEVESAFRPGAVSPAGAIGLMQVMPATGAWLAARAGRPERGEGPHLLEPEWNVALGVRYLSLLIRQFGRVDEALVAYNAGPARAREVLSGEARPRWLAGYPRKVLSLHDGLRRCAAVRWRCPGADR
jgi:soluble lytic murein transglycosylase